MKLPVCTPPCWIAERTAARSCRRRRSRSSGESSDVGRRGAIRACHRTWSASRLPTPEIAPWFEQPCLDGGVAGADQAPELVAADVRGIRPDVAEVRVEQRPAEPAPVAQRKAAAVLELDREAVPDRLVGRRLERDRAGHAEVQTERRPVVRDEPEELAAPVGADERVTDERRRDLAGRMRTADVRVAVVDRGDPPAEHRLQRHAGALGFGELGIAASLEATLAPHAAPQPVACADVIALITGASSGIGAATARRLACEPGDVRLVLVARRGERLREIADELEAARANVRATVIAADLTDADAPARIAAQVEQEHGRLDLLVNNAGAAWRARFAEGGWENVRRHMELNFDAQVRLTEALLPLLRGSAPSAIVNVSSTAGRVGRGGTGAYSAAKFAFAGWTDALHLEEAPHGVHVGLVLPGFVATEGFPQQQLVGQLEDALDRLDPGEGRRRDPRRRPGRARRALRPAGVLARGGGADRAAALHPACAERPPPPALTTITARSCARSRRA